MHRDDVAVVRSARRPALHRAGESLSPSYGALSRRHNARHRVGATPSERYGGIASGEGQQPSVATGRATRALSRGRAIPVRTLSRIMKTTSRILIGLSIVACTKGSQPSVAQQTQTSASTSVSEGRRTAITAAVASVAP